MNLRSLALTRERLTSPFFWHLIVACALLILTIVLAVRFGMDWVATNDSSNIALANKEIQLKALDLQTAPMRGIDKRVEESRAKLQAFYDKRIPASYSAIAARIGDLQVKSGVRLSRVQYTQGVTGTDLTEITMDVGISGNYPAILRFVNSIERDQAFFVIRAMSLTGQQGGTVNLRIRISTWLRPADAAASDIPLTFDDTQATAAKQVAGKPSPAVRKEGK
jgi:Tfp pilus assembly protein PilO